ncbi:hypothetical protein P7C70_g962, partial [Phenoliferia sp. Uapishka_3]
MPTSPYPSIPSPLPARQHTLSQLDQLSQNFKSLRSSFVHPPSLIFHPQSSTTSSTVPTLVFCSENKPFMVFQESLLRLLTSLDAIESGGDDFIKLSRKALVSEVQAEMDSWEEWKDREWELSVVVGMTKSPCPLTAPEELSRGVSSPVGPFQRPALRNLNCWQSDGAPGMADSALSNFECQLALDRGEEGLYEWETWNEVGFPDDGDDVVMEEAAQMVSEGDYGAEGEEDMAEDEAEEEDEQLSDNNDHAGVSVAGSDFVTPARPVRKRARPREDTSSEDEEATVSETEAASSDVASGISEGIRAGEGGTSRAKIQRSNRKESALKTLSVRHLRPQAKIALVFQDGSWRCMRCGRASSKTVGSRLLQHFKSDRCTKLRTKERKEEARLRDLGSSLPFPLASSSPLRPKVRKGATHVHRRTASDASTLSFQSPSTLSISSPSSFITPSTIPSTSASSTGALPPLIAEKLCENARVPVHPLFKLDEYPWRHLHNNRKEPWRVVSRGGVLYIKDPDCPGVVEEGQATCWWCLRHLTDERIMELETVSPQEREDKMPHLLNQRTVGQLVRGQRRNRLENKDKWLKSKNMARGLRRSKNRGRLLSQIIKKVSTLPPSARAAAIIKHALENKGGYRTILRHLLDAEIRKRRLRKWTDLEIAAFIVACLTGRNRCVSALHGAIGAPGRTFLRERIGNCHLLPAVGSPKQIVAIILENLTTLGFPPPLDPSAPKPPIINLYTLASDEVAIRPVIEYNPRLNCFVGLGYRKCVNSGLDITFSVMEDARKLCEILESKEQDFSTNMKAMGFTFHDRFGLGTHFYPVVLMAEAGSGRTAELEQEIADLVEEVIRERMSWHGLAPGGSASDGDAARALMEQRRSCRYLIVEGHPLYERVKRMSGFTSRLGKHDCMPEGDCRHIFKALRACDARPKGSSLADVGLPPDTLLEQIVQAYPDVPAHDHMKDIFPEDGMKVAPAISLIKKKAALPPASTLPSDTSNTFRRQREALEFASSGPGLFLSPFVDADLSTEAGLYAWAQGGWETYIRYLLNPTNGLSSQVVLALLKTIHSQFVRAMRRQDIAVAQGIDVEHILTQVGEDPVEGFFGGLKYAGGFDTHLTLNNAARYGGETILMNRLLNEHPVLQKGSKGHRNISTHLTGNLNVRYLDFPTIWNVGRERAFAHAREYPQVIDPALLDRWEKDIAEGLSDFLRPNGWYLRWDRQEQLAAGVNLRPLDGDAESARLLSEVIAAEAAETLEDVTEPLPPIVVDPSSTSEEDVWVDEEDEEGEIERRDVRWFMQNVK